MGVFVLVCLAVAVTTSVGGSESPQARGFDEDPWSSMAQPWTSMTQQPEVLIVKEKGGGGSAASNMKMKDITPIICLLAPLLLAAIILPAKMSMMMNGMMGTNGMMPMIPMMPIPIQNGLFMPNTNLPLTALLTSGLGGNNNNNLGLPIFKDFIASKMYSQDTSREIDDRNSTESPVGFASNFNESSEENALEYKKINKKNEWYATSVPQYVTTVVPKIKKKNEQKKNKGDAGNSEWSSRVWSAEEPKANELLNLFNVLSYLF